MAHKELVWHFLGATQQYTKKWVMVILGLVASLCLLSGCEKQGNPLNKIDKNNTEATGTLENEVPPKEHHIASPIRIIEPAQNEGLESSSGNNGEIVRVPSKDNQIRSTGAWNIVLNLKSDRIYRLNQFRDAGQIKTYPELFGVGNDFEPFISMEAKGPGTIKINGRSFEEISIDCGPTKEKIEVYPLFKKDFLLSTKENQKDEVQITFEKDGVKTLIDRFPLRWTNQREIYLKDKNLNDIITLVETAPLRESTAFANAKQWLVAAVTGLNKFNIVLDPIEKDQDFVTIRTSKEMREKRRASKYDICVWLANKALEYGFEVEIIALPNHCILAVSELPTKKGVLNTSTQYYIEGEELIDSVATPLSMATNQNLGNINKKVDLALKKGEERISKEFKDGADKMFALKIKEWEKAYRHLKQL